ncbi:MAG: Cytochrome bd-I ubiquinol oxidase subunit 2 [Chlamydiae bacterium]|nr:Cytochrome bd-I ubiquinol oxidase subunit 2 [Chlamydiota bacterium]
MILAIAFYLVIVFAVIAYAVLDGFDLGVGMLHLFAKKDLDRRIFLNAIGPVWDGNEVWLVIVIGGLFAGFPPVYATILSSFYIPVMILLMGLIFRAVSIEFRSKRESTKWRKTWDGVFAFGSYVISFGVGIILGNLITGIPLNEDQVFLGSFFDFFHPYAVLIGLTTVALFQMHGAIFLVMKTEGELQDRIRKWVPKSIILFMSLYILTTFATIYELPYMTAPMRTYPALFLIPIIALAAIFTVPFLMKKRREGWAFLSSCLSITLLLSLAVIGTFPYMVRSTTNTAQNSLQIANASSSELTLKVLMIIVAIGVPLVLAYGFWVYRIFRGKVKIDPTSY